MSLKDRLVPALYDAMNEKLEEGWAGEKRRELLTRACGRVLEVGVGTGRNLRHYPRDVDAIVALDPSAGMLERARRRAAEAGRDVRFVRGSAAELPFADDEFDTVVSTLVLCSVPDQAQTLRELRRVLKADGQLLFLEHVRWDDPERARWQDRLEGLWTKVACGCHPNRDTLAAIRAAGFSVDAPERGHLPKAPPIVRPYVAGRGVAPTA